MRNRGIILSVLFLFVCTLAFGRADNPTSTRMLNNNYLRLDTTNDPLTNSLEVEGEISADNSIVITGTDSTDAFRINDGSGGFDRVMIRNGGIVYMGDIDANGDAVAIRTNGSNKIFVDSNGHVGINKSVPLRPLDVEVGAGGSTLNALALTATGGSTNGAMIFYPLTDAANPDWVWLTNSGEDIQIKPSNVASIFAQATTGWVGIGTTGPGQQLNVRDDLGVTAGEHAVAKAERSTGNFTGVHLGYYADGANDTGGAIFGNSAKPLYLGDTNNARMVTILNNFVGIGDTSPESILTIDPGNVGSTSIGGRDIHLGVTTYSASGRTSYLSQVGNNFTGDDDNGLFYAIYPFDTGGNAASKLFRGAVGTTLSDVFYVRQDGGAYFADDVGIGTTSPSETLHVAGTVSIDSTLTVSDDVTITGDLNLTGALYGGNWVRLHDETLTAAAQTITISGLTLNDYDEIKLMANMLANNVGGLAPTVTFNNDTGANYGEQYVLWTNATHSGASAQNKTGMYFGYAPNQNEQCSAKLTAYPKSGFLRPTWVSTMDGMSGESFNRTMELKLIWNNTADEITSIEVVGSGANEFKIGSRFTLWGLKQ